MSKKNTDKSNLVNQAEAGRIAGVSRVAIGKIIKTGNYNFYDVENKKVDISHPHWEAYLNERGKSGGDRKSVKSKTDNGQKGPQKKSVKKSKKKSGKSGKQKEITDKLKSLIPENEHHIIDKITKEMPGIGKALLETAEKIKKEDGKEHPKQQNALTGGYDPALMIPTTPAQLKALTDIQEKNINMRHKLNELIDTEMVVSIMEVVIKDIKSFVSLGRKVSNLICQKLDRVGMEKQVEAIIDPEIESIIKMLKKNMERNIDIKSYK